AASHRLHQPVFDICRVGGQSSCDFKMFEGSLGSGIRLFVTMFTPGQVIKRPATVGDAPVRHHAFGIEFERLAKALYSLAFVETKAPVQAQIEPALGLG